MKMLKSVLKNKIKVLSIFIVLLFVTSDVLFASNVYNPVYFDMPSGPVVLKDMSLIVTGDSFAGKFCDMESNRDLKVIPYAIAGQTIDQNKIIMAQALNFDEKNVMFSIGVNDMYVETYPFSFESVLRELMVIAEFNKKNVIMHSYLRFFSENYYEKKFDAFMYDSIIRKICNEYENAYYIDVHDLERQEYISEDLMHYNKLFYDELYNRVFKLLYQLEAATVK